ncbi:hypothetical protein F5Y11DRAFT_358166 [Daldinia sp. FL1419]|nr:hypothetical protein F5Y11DRAFT_358166 [Daldinia sp. FL1419]
MPTLDEISYSRDEAVATIRNYYRFLTKMYLKESDVIEPPQGGWPNLRANLQSFEKSDEVISLLRHLPYIRRPSDDRDRKISDWAAKGRMAGEDFKMLSEDFSIREDVPPHVVGLTFGGRNNPIFLLDTELGVRAEGQYWAIPDFFGVLEDQFRELKFIPTSSRTVMDVYTTPGPYSDGMIPMLRDIYREHGWPDLERYRKRECLEAVQMALEERYPDYAHRRDDE